MRTVKVKTPACRQGMRPESLTGDIFRDTCKVDGREVELFRCEGIRYDIHEPDFFWSFTGHTGNLVLEWSTDPRDVILNGSNAGSHWEHPLYECYCGVLVRKDGEPCQHCEAEDVTDYPAPPPLMTDAEALAAIKRLRRYDDDLRNYEAQYKALKKVTEDKRERFLDLEGERLQAWTASKLKGNRRSVRTLEGVAQFRTVPARVRIVDEALALAWACEEGMVAPKMEIVMPRPTAFQKIGDDGTVGYEAPPGFEVIPERTTFTVKGTAPAEGDGDDE